MRTARSRNCRADAHDDREYCASKKQPVITKPTSVPLTKVDLLGQGFKNNFDWDQDLSHDYTHGYLGDCDSAASRPTDSNPCKMDGFDLSYSGANG